MSQITLARHPDIKGAEILSSVFDVAAPIEEVFPYFAAARNLESITPKWLKFEVISAPDREIREGDLLIYHLKVKGFPLTWHSLISRWDAPHCFVDQQEKGPYSLWRHTHSFEEIEGGTRCLDRVEFRAPFAWITHPLFVRRDVLGIFKYREKVLGQHFGAL